MKRDAEWRILPAILAPPTLLSAIGNNITVFLLINRKLRVLHVLVDVYLRHAGIIERWFYISSIGHMVRT